MFRVLFSNSWNALGLLLFSEALFDLKQRRNFEREKVGGFLCEINIFWVAFEFCP